MSLRKFWIETYGCQMNKAESESMIIQLKQSNLIPAANCETADLVILNTCSVRKTAEDRIWGRIGHYKHLKTGNPELKLAIVGCMAERLKNQLLSDGVVDLVIGNFEKKHIGELILRLQNNKNDFHHQLEPDAHQYTFFRLHTENSDNLKSYIPIMHGCNNWCSYCIVPYVRGREVSRNPDEILSEIKILESKGIREITLLGQNVNSYNFSDDGHVLTFPQLLKLILKNINIIEWIRFLTSHPKDISDELIALMQDNPVLCRHIHLPVQHGSNKILKSMGRGYSREEYIALIEKIREKIDGVSITTDILIGFPGEDEEDFLATLELMKNIRFSEAFTYKYNPREGTKAFLMEDTVPEEQKLFRLRQVIDLQRSITEKNKMRQIGKTVKVLIESFSKKSDNEYLGRTERDETVVFPCGDSKIGSFTHVEIINLNGNTFQGKEV